jgi:hypothetical protein
VNDQGACQQRSRALKDAHEALLENVEVVLQVDPNLLHSLL